MASWFDTFAKKSSQRAAGDESGTLDGLSRRRLIVGGSAAVAAAWTAPVLLASSAAAVGVSTCPPPSKVCGTSFATSICCTATQVCYPTGGAGGAPVCAAPDTLGGVCSNQGEGVCADGSKCNSPANGDSCNYCTYPHTCGGEGTQCNSASDCFGSSSGFAVCSGSNAQSPGSKFCRRTCASNAQCNTARGQICDNGLCALPCNTDQQCPDGNAVCVGGTGNANSPTKTGICNYKDQGGIAN
jgi:hypothetical protein